MVFDKQWFQKHNNTLCWFANTPVIKYWFRWLLRVHNDIPFNVKINKISPNSFTYGKKLILTKEGLRQQQKADFRTHDKFSKRLYFGLKPFWYILHFMDWAMLDRCEELSKLSFGFSTLTQYPGSTATNNPVDGRVYRNGVNETFSTIRAGAGVGVSLGDGICPFLTATSTSNQYYGLERGITCFDTSALTSGATISESTLSYYGLSLSAIFGGTRNDLGSPVFHVAGATPAATNNLVAADYGKCQTTSFGTVANASWSESAYNDTTLNASGISNISKTGISKFSTQLSWDILNSTTGLTWSNGKTSGFRYEGSVATGTSFDPKLVVTYTSVVGPANVKTYKGLVSSSVKTLKGLAIASCKSKKGLA